MKSFKFDVALSFAGEHRKIADEIASHLTRNGLRVFYDSDYQHDLLGLDLADHFASLYRRDAEYCVMLLSEEYKTKLWCSWERRAILARVFDDRSDYLLPYRIDDVDIDSIPPTIGCAWYRNTSPDEFARLVISKFLGRNRSLAVSDGVILNPAADCFQVVQRFTEGLRHEDPDTHWFSLRAVFQLSNNTKTDFVYSNAGDLHFHTLIGHPFTFGEVVPASRKAEFYFQLGTVNWVAEIGETAKKYINGPEAFKSAMDRSLRRVDNSSETTCLLLDEGVLSLNNYRTNCIFFGIPISLVVSGQDISICSAITEGNNAV